MTMNDQFQVLPQIARQAQESEVPAVLIGVVNYNRPSDTIECLTSLITCSYPRKEVVLFDNGSKDDSVRQIRETFPFLSILESKSNLGASGARNHVIRWARQRNPDFLLMIDNDTIVEKEFLQPLVDAMKNDTEAAVACGTILEYDHRDIIWFAGGSLVPLRGLAVHDHAGKRFDRKRNGSPRRVSYITVCMTLYRFSMLENIGLLDERYFVYLEDIEFATRLVKQGYKQLYVPASVIYHKVRGERDSTFKLYYCVRNRLLLIREGFGGLEGNLATIYFLAVILSKLLVWRVVRHDFYIAAKAGLVDYFKGNFGEGRGTIMFSDARTQVTTSIPSETGR